jgi:hypothetical protein
MFILTIFHTCYLLAHLVQDELSVKFPKEKGDISNGIEFLGNITLNSPSWQQRVISALRRNNVT